MSMALELLYIHGFLSSPLSFKALSMGRWLQDKCPQCEFICPMLTPYPAKCAETLMNIVETAQRNGTHLGLVGSSMGGFWSTYLAERYDLPAVLINPAVDVLRLMPAYIGQHLKNYHTEDVYCIQEGDLHELASYDTPAIRRHGNYWLLVQQGDETLDYQLAVEKYQGCRQTVEPDGDHSFQGFERFHDDVIAFFEAFYQHSL